jgi:hypothetical protein
MTQVVKHLPTKFKFQLHWKEGQEYSDIKGKQKKKITARSGETHL